MEIQEIIDYLHSRYIYKEAATGNGSLEARKMRLQYDKARIEQQIEEINRALGIDEYPKIQEMHPW